MKRFLCTWKMLAVVLAFNCNTSVADDWWQACSAERQRLCSNVPAGGGRVAVCINDHYGELSPACKTSIPSQQQPVNAPPPVDAARARTPVPDRGASAGPVNLPSAMPARVAGRSSAPRNEVMNYLAGLPGKSGKKVLSGQHSGDAQPAGNPFSAQSGYAKYIEALRASTGKRVAVVGAGYDALMPAVAPLDNLLAVNAVVKTHWNQGGLVELGAAPHNPWTGGMANDNKLNGHRLTEAITPGAPANQQWMKELDAFATALEDLQSAGVVVLWRPFHEFNGDWFWWGAARDGQDYVSLWRHMHDYFVNVRKLDNLIWVWAGSREAGPWVQPLAKYYPGDAYVDIVGIDIYSDTLDQAAVNAYRDLSRYGKPFALAEYGPDNKTTTKTGTLDLTTLIKQIKAVMPNVVYFKTWSDYVGPAGNMYWSLLSNKRAAELLSDPWVVNADDVPRFGRPR